MKNDSPVDKLISELFEFLVVPVAASIAFCDVAVYLMCCCVINLCKQRCEEED